MKRTLAFGLAAVSMVFMISCGSDTWGDITGSKKETKAQFFNESSYQDGSSWTAKLRLGDYAELTAVTGTWSGEAVINDCDGEHIHMATLYDNHVPVYVFTNVPIECENHNLYTIRVLGFQHYIEWRTGGRM